MALSKLAFGLSAAVPTEAKAAWGARAIFERGGFSLVWDRQDLQAETPEDKERLVKFLNGGGLEAAQKAFAKAKLRSDEDRLVTLYDKKGCKIVCNPNGSYGYVYLAGWV